MTILWVEKIEKIENYSGDTAGDIVLDEVPAYESVFALHMHTLFTCIPD